MAFNKGVSMSCPYHKDTICYWDWGEGVAGFNMAQKGRAGDVIIMRWTIKC